MQLVMTSDEAQIRIFADWSVSHLNRVPKDNRKTPRISCRCRERETAEKLWPNHVKNEQHIGSKRGEVTFPEI